jgi:hypothetical protein
MPLSTLSFSPLQKILDYEVIIVENSEDFPVIRF